MTKIVSIRKVANGSFQAEMEGNVQRPGAINALALLNKGDARFVSGSKRMAWFPVTMQSLRDLGVDESTITKLMNAQEKEKVAVSIENPTLDGHKLAIQVKESIFPDVYQRQNASTTAKQLTISEEVSKNTKLKTDFDLSKYVGQLGYFLDAEGNHIFSRTSVTIEAQINHTFVEGTLVPETELGSYGATLAEAVVTEAVEA